MIWAFLPTWRSLNERAADVGNDERAAGPPRAVARATARIPDHTTELVV